MARNKQDRKNGITRREFLAGAVATAGTAALAACGTQEAETKEKPKLVVWQGQTYTPEADERYKEQCEEWAEENNVELDYSYMAQDEAEARWKVATESKQFPDLANIRNEDFLRLVLAGDLLETTEIVNRLNKKEGGFTEGALSSIEADGKYWAVPSYGSTEMFYVRKDKLDEKGLALPETWQDVLDVAKAITVPGEFWGWGPQLGTASWDSEVACTSKLWAHGARTWDKEGKPAIDSPETRQVLNFMKEAWDAGVIPPDAPTWDDAGNNKAFQTGIVGMAFNTGSILGYLQKEDPELYDKTAFVMIPEGPAGRFCSGYFYKAGVFSSTEHPDVALEMLEWLWSPEQVRERVKLAAGNRMPMYKGLYEDEMWNDPSVSVLASMIPYTVPQGYPGPTSPWCLDAWHTDHVVARMFGRVLFEGWDNDRAVGEAMTTCQKWYDDWQERLEA